MTGTPTILVVNCNTDERMTDAIGRIARSAAAVGTQIVAIGPRWGPASAEGYAESYATAVATMDAVLAHEGAFDAVVMAGFGEHGREGMRQAISQPVVDITEAAAFLACLVGHRFGVVTTVRSAIAGIEDSLRAAGILDRCAAIIASDLPVSHIGDDVDATAAALERASREVLARGADVLVLGCAGFAGLDRALEGRLGVPVIDGVAGAVVMAEALVGLGKSTSTAGPYAPLDAAKAWRGPRLGEARPGSGAGGIR